MAAEVERKLAAILSADVVGYSRLMAEDEAGTIRTLSSYRKEIHSLVGEHRGRVVDTTGDNLLAEFPTALDAVECGVEIQRVLAARNASLREDHRMEFRIGIHLGDLAVQADRLYGEGVNIAARLEALAEPGGICVSSEVHGQVRHRLGLEFEDLGEQSLKNIAAPVRALRIRVKPKQPDLALPGMDERTVPGFGGRPAIAVLPFDNLSGDPEQEYFADGIAEDLITRISAQRLFPVIARNSSFTYKGRAVDVTQVSRDLGVRYVVEGSVRKAGDRVRISAQLIDATTAEHVWAEKYDRDLTDIFSLQDEITGAIVGSMLPELGRAEEHRAARKEPQSLEAWECVARGWWHIGRFTKDHNRKARLSFERAIELDSEYADAFGGLASTHHQGLLLQWTDSRAESVAELDRTARMAAELDPNSALVQLALGYAYSAMGQRERMIDAFRLAVQLDPSHPVPYQVLGFELAMAAMPDEAIPILETAMRLDPRNPQIWMSLYSMGLAHLAAERYEEAIEWAQRSLQRRAFGPAYRVIAASYGHLNQIAEARAAVDELLRCEPSFSLTAWKNTRPAIAPAFLERFIDGLRKAGLKEE